MHNPYHILFVLPPRILKDLSIKATYPLLFSMSLLIGAIGIDIVMLYKVFYVQYFGENLLIRNVAIGLMMANSVLTLVYFYYNNNYERIYKKYERVKINLLYKLFFYLFYTLSFLLFLQEPTF